MPIPIRSWRVTVQKPGSPRWLRAVLLLGLLGFPGLAPAWLKADGPAQVVVVDAGHGGDDAGVMGRDGTSEEEITLRLALQFAGAMKDVAGVAVFLDRDGDENMSVEERAITANRKHPAVMLSLHCGFSRRPEETGIRVYYYLPGRSQLDKYHVLKESTTGGTVRLVPWDLAQVGHLAASRELAGTVQQKVAALEGSTSGSPTGCALVPLQSIDSPAVLLEVGFLSNPQDEARLRDPAYRESLARALREAVLEFLASPAAKGGGQ